MEILIKKLAKGHYVQVKFDDGNTEEFAVGKWHALVSALRPYLWDKKESPKKSVAKKQQDELDILS